MDDDRYEQFFLQPQDPWHRRYEALRAVFVEGQSMADVAQRLDVAHGTVRNWASEFRKQRDHGQASPFFARLVVEVAAANPLPKRRINATGVGVETQLGLTFSEAIQKGTGDLVLKRVADGASVETTAVGSAAVAVVGNTVTVARSVRLSVLVPGMREVAQLLFSVTAVAATGVTPLDIEPSDPAAGGYTWTASDGSLWIGAASDWHNEANPLDVNGDDAIEPVDALIIINYINAHPGQVTLPSPGSIPHQYYDVNDDGDCTAWDVLIVVNHLNAQPLMVAEGEPLADRIGATQAAGIALGTAEAGNTSTDRVQDHLFADAQKAFWPLEDVLADLAEDLSERGSCGWGW